MENPNSNIIFAAILLSIWLYCFPLPIHAQEFENIKFDRITSENEKLIKGLSQNWVYAILQDRYGYMWFGTWEGLNKYDGYNFTVYNVNDGLSNHTIFSLLDDDEGFLWIGTDRGFNKFNRYTQTFTQYLLPNIDSSGLFPKRVNSIIQSKDGSIWLGTGSGLYQFNKKTESFFSFLNIHQDFDSPRSNFIIRLFEDNTGLIWVSTTYGLVKFDPNTRRSTRYYHIQGDSTSLSGNNIRCVIQEKSGNFWIGTTYGLNYYNTESQKIKQYYNNPDDPFSMSDNWIRVIFEDKSGDIWIGTNGGGLNFYARENDQFIRYQNILNDKNSLSNDKIYSIYEDNAGNLWVGTNKGVNRINKYYNDFKHCRRTTNDDRSLNDNTIWSFAEDDDENLWIGTVNGINIKNKESDKYSYLVRKPGNSNSLIYNDIRTMVFSPDKTCVWIGTWGGGMDKYDLIKKKFTHYQHNLNRNSICNNYVNDLLVDKDGFLWIATGNGLNRFNYSTNFFETFLHNPSNSISNNICICLFEDSKGNLWIGTDKGLNCYKKSGNIFSKYFHDQNNSNGLSNNTIFCIHEDKTGKIWAGTSGGGIICLNPETGKFKTFTTKEGLPNDVVYGILEDNEGNLWISTNLGLSKFYIVSERFVNYDVKDGIQSNEFNLGAYYLDSYNQMYFGGVNGFNIFNPDEIKYNPNKPVVVISAFRKFNEIQQEEYYNGDTIHLRYDDNFFSFEISALDYTNPAKNKYQYKLDRVDKDWIYADANNRQVEYKKVMPGTYTFLAKGSNNDGIWNEEGISLTVVISPPWWSTWLFRFFVVSFIIAIIWYIIFRRVRRIRKKHEAKEKMLNIEKQMFDLEQKALRLQMNPHFIFNSLNSIQSYIIAHNAEKAVEYLGKFSQLMRLILSNSTNKFVLLKEELRAIRYYIDLEKLRFDNKFKYEITLDSKVDEEFIEILPMIIQPYIENAIIHGLIHKHSEGKIKIDFRLNEDILICTVRDNGIGREKAMQINKESGIIRKSRGMLITKERLDIMNRQSDDDFSVKVIDLKDENGNATGTKVQLNIRYNEV